MRYFPSASGRSLAAAALVGVVLSGAAAPIPSFTTSSASTADGDQLRQDQKKVQREIDKAGQDLQHSSQKMRRAFARASAARAELDSAKDRLSDVRRRLEEAREKDAATAERLAATEERLVVAKEELKEGRKALSKQRRLVRDNVADAAAEGPAELAALDSLLSSRSLEDLERREAANEAILGRQGSLYDDLDAAEVQLTVRKRSVADTRDERREARQDAAEQLDAVTALTAEAKAARDEVRTVVTKAWKTRKQASRAQRQDKKRLAKLRAQERRIKQRIEALARSSKGVSAQADGYLLSPLAAPVTSSFGWRIHPIYGYRSFHNGTDFGATCGTGMLAAGTGRVVSKYYSSSYGNRLFLYLGKVNGKSLTVVYNHAQGYRYDVGDTVKRGAVVGGVGDTGWSTGCHLHFTVLVGGTAVDPMNWL